MSAVHHHPELKTQPAAKPANPNSHDDSLASQVIPMHAPSATSDSQVDPLLQQAWVHAVAEQYEKALSVLAKGNSAPHYQNARGVCLLRLGRYEEAVRMLRGVVLQAGGTWTKANLPMHYQTNLATALLLSGRPSGCLSLLDEIQSETHPLVIRLRKALKDWQASLSLWNKLNWWCGRIDPPNCHPKLDYPAGDFTEEGAITGNS